VEHQRLGDVTILLCLRTTASLEFGSSIHGCMMEHRLSQAHAALRQTDTSIKQLAARLGYAHVSNFTIAYKRKFGYPPGSLRRKHS
jgi:AraC-like DNA-binding protein